MKKISKTTLKDLADSLLITLNEEEYKFLLDDFDVLLKQFKVTDNLGSLDMVEPMTFPFKIESVGLREDVSENTLTVEEVLKNAKDTKANQIKINKVVK